MRFGKTNLRRLTGLFTLAFAGILLICTFSSCEVGLGSAVDTQSPSIEIANPPVDAVIRDNFALSGKYSDDGTIVSVKADLKRVDINTNEFLEFTDFHLTYDEVEKGAGTWSIPIDALSEDKQTKLIPDGTYQAVITIKDKSSHTTVQNTTFTIDNTPPVIVLQRPGTDLEATLSNADTYGQVFTLEGLGADDNNIDHIDVTVYADKERTIKKHTVTINNIPPTINLDVAQYGDDVYTAIYGNVAPADFAPAQFYCSIIAYDSAKKYPVDGISSADDENGNSTDIYYIYEDISKDVLKSTKITEVYHIMNGTAQFNSSRSAIETNAIIQKLAQNQKTLGSFVLDPKNNPTFSVAGKPTLLAGANAECLKDATDYTIPNDSDITIQVNVGLDNSPIVNDADFKVYFQKCKFENGKYVADGPKIYPEINAENGKKKIGSNYQFTVNVKSSEGGLEVEKSYLIGVDGKDENGQPILSANNGYGFYLVSMSSAPTLKDIQPSESTIYVGKNSSLTITGKTTLTEGKPVVSIKYGDDTWDSSGELTTPIEGSTYAFSLTVDAATFNANNGNASKEFALEIRAANGDKTSSTYKSVMYDIDPPTVNELTVSPEIKDNTTYVLNGEVTFKALLEDDFTAVKSWHYEMWQGGTKKYESSSYASSKVEFTYDTTALEDNTAATVKIIAEDKAGNKKTEEIPCFINQSTDKPSFEAQDGVSWNRGILNPYYMKQNAKNVISGSLYSKVTDDDSVAFVKFEVKAITPKADTEIPDAQKSNPLYEGYDIDDDQSGVGEGINSRMYIKTGRESSVTHTMPSKSGFYLVTQTVYDKNFVCAGSEPTPEDEDKTVNGVKVNQNYFVKENYVIKISGVGPQYSLTRDTSYISPNNTNKDLKVTIDIEDGEPPYRIWRNDEELEFSNPSASTFVDTFKVSKIISNENIISVKYKVSDINGVTLKEIKYSKDSLSPTFNNPKIEPNTETYTVYKTKEGEGNNAIDVYFLNNEKQTFTISGLAEDNTSVDKVYLTIENTEGSGTDITKESDTGYFNGIKFADFKQDGTVDSFWTGKATIKIKVVDIAGNESEETKLNIRFDSTEPTPEHQIDDSSKDLDVRIGDYQNDAHDPDVGGKYSFGTYGSALTIMLRGYFPDNEGGSGINKFYYKVFRKEVKIDSSKDDNTTVGDDIYFKSFDSLKAYVIANKDDTFSPITKESRNVEYNIKPTGTPATAANTVGRYGGSTVNGYTVNEKGYVQFRTSVYSNYKTTIKGFQEGRNYLVLVAEDNVGNTRLDYAEDVPTPGDPTQTDDYPCYSLNVDITTPTISGTNAGVTQYVNVDSSNTDANVKVNITGTVSDKPTSDPTGSSGIKKIVFTSDGSDGTVKTYTTTPAPTALDSTLMNWTADIKSLLPSSGTVIISAKVTDNAGFEASEPVAKIFVDKEPPEVTFSNATPAAESKVNKTFTIGGIVDDKTGAGVDASDVPTVYWTTKASVGTVTPTGAISPAANANAGWVLLGKAAWDENAAGQTWNYSIDTETLKPDGTSVITDKTPIYITVSAKDKSTLGTGTGNTGYAAPRKIIVDQNSDRPVIKFSNLDISAMTDSNRIWITKEDLYASINDDDGEVQSVEISFDGTNWSSEDAQHNKYYTPENGLAYPIPSDKDGEQTIYFRVKDGAGTSFTSSLSSDAAVTTAPKLAYKNIEFGDTANKYYSVIYAKVDLGDPAIPLAYYTTASDETVPVANANALLTLLKKDNQNNLTDELTETAKQTWKDLSGVKTAVGGTTKYIYIFAKAKDANGIDTITAKFGEDSIAAVYTIGTDDVEATGKGKLALFKINITSAQTKDYKLELKATDNASRNITRTLDMNIDKQASKVYIDSPSENASLYGTPGVADSNVTVRGRSDGDAEHIYMAVKKSESDSPEEEDWVEITKNSALTWNVIFNGKKGQASQTDYYEDRYNTWVDTLYGTGTSTNNNITEKPVCLYFYAVDTLGNTGIANPEKLPLTIFTQGDRPTVEITSPEKPRNNALSTVGGIITITGSTTIAINSVENIWLQIDPDYSGADDGSGFADNWEEKLTALINGMTEEQLSYKLEASGNATIGNAIKAGGSKTSWNRAINKNSEFNKKNAQNELINRTIAVRAYAVSASGKVSSCDTVVFTLDPNAPVFGQLDGYPLKLVQYANNEAGSGNITASRLYEAGLYLKGKWWLTGSVSDDSGIASITMDNVSVMANCSTTGAAISGKYNYLMNIPLSGEGKIEPKIVATEGAETSKTSELPIVLNFDNASPDFVSTSLNASEATQIVQSDGVYEIRGTFNDNMGSGFERIAFYVTRDGYLTDIMIPQGLDISDNSYLLTGLTHTANDNNDLYWKSLSQCKVQNGTEVLLKTYTMQTLPSYVRRGAVCRINNIIYRINKIESNADATYQVKLTIDSKIDDAASVTVDVALAQIIDNKVAEQGITDSYDTDYDLPEHSSEEKFSNDDHDQMVERFNETSGEWTVSINSQNIKDGAITIHFVAYDKAGNVTYKAYQGVVANNAPRFAGVTFGTDVNGDGVVEGASELKTVYTGWYNANSEFKKEGVKENGKAANGNKITTWALPNNDRNITVIDDTADPVMTVKGKIKIIPEIVGGNNGLGWKYKIGDGNYSNYQNLTGAGHSGTTDIRDTSTTAFEIDTAELYTKSGSDGVKIFTFTISDKTGGDLGDASNSTADLILKMNVALRDGTAPTAGIKPFYWNAAGDGNNSLYYSGTPATAQGHIELPEDLPDTFAYSATANELYDVDPKVSGIVYLEGFAKDNVVVEELYLRATKSGAAAGAFTKVASRDRTAGTNYGKFKADTTLAGDGIEFISCTEETVVENGIDYNVVHWKVAVNSAMIANVAVTDIAVEVQAKDRGAPTVNGSTVTYTGTNQQASATSTEQTGISVTDGVATFTDEVQTAYYRVDVVPYVTEVKRYNKYNTNRARSGAVSLLRGEASNLVKGFNLASETDTSIKIVPNKDGSGDAKAMEEVAVSGTDLSFKVPTSAKTGYLHVVVNNVPALNNMNGYVDYNTETNNKSYDHNTLTDDRYVHIWRVSQQDTFKGSKNAVYPAMTSYNGTLYASFTNYGQSKTYYTKEFIGNGTVGVSEYNGVKSESSGGWFSTTTYSADDSIQTNGVATVFWGYDPPEETAIAVSDSGDVNVFYAANYHGGSADDWDNNAVGDAGGIYVYDTDAKDTLIQSNNANTKRAKIYRSELYTYDDELNQFKNLRIVRSGNYIYLAYYDRLRGSIKTSVINDSNKPDTSTNGLPWINLDGGSDTEDSGGGSFSFAGEWKPFVNTNYGNGVAARTSSTGESVAITTNTSGYPVLLYMDANTGCLRIARASSVNPTSADKWSVQGVFATTDDNYDTASDYMSCIVDSQGYLHIAFQNTKGQLVYTKSTNNPSNGTTAYAFGSSQVLDDSGMWIDMTMNGNTPYISYLSRVNSYDGMKIAFLDPNFDANNDGEADIGGGWETLTAALDAKVTNIRTCIEPNAKAADSNSYTAAIGFSPGSDYRAAFYVGK